MTYKQIHAVYPNRSVGALQRMVHRAAKAGEVTLHHPTKWWGPADQIRLERAYCHRTIDRAAIQAMYPSRQWSSLRRRLGEIPKRYHRQLFGYYRRRLVRHGAVRVHPGAWSYQAHCRGHRDACFLVTPRFLIRRTTANWLHRCLVGAEARDGTVRLRLSHAQWGRRYRRCYRGPRVRLPRATVNALRASLLADGSSSQFGQFGLVQSATHLPGNRNHSPYLFRTLWRLRRTPLTPGALNIRRGLRRTVPYRGLAYTWKVSFRLFLCRYHLPELRQDHHPAGSTRQRKRLPSNAVLLRDYFRHPGLTLAVLHMEDGSLHHLSDSVSVPRLHAYTTDPEDCLRLSLVIYRVTGLRYVTMRYPAKT